MIYIYKFYASLPKRSAYQMYQLRDDPRLTRVGRQSGWLCVVCLKRVIRNEHGAGGEHGSHWRTSPTARKGRALQRATMQSAVRSPAYSGHTAPTPTFMQPTSAGQNPQKRRRTDSVPVNGSSVNGGPQQFVQHDMNHTPLDAQLDITQAPSQSMHIPKRGARACTACRKGKNRCEGEVKHQP
jgi:hypothetical protein